MLCGPLKRAAPFAPSVLPYIPGIPAIVLTMPDGVILRIVELLESVTYTFPALSTATLKGESNCASLPIPSAIPMPGALPAKVVNVYGAV